MHLDRTGCVFTHPNFILNWQPPSLRSIRYLGFLALVNNHSWIRYLSGCRVWVLESMPNRGCARYVWHSKFEEIRSVFRTIAQNHQLQKVCTRYRTGPILPLMYRSLRKSGNTKSVNYHQSGYLILPLLKCNIEIPNARKVGQALQSHRRNIDLEIKHSLERRTWNMRMTASSVLGYIIPKPPHNMLGD